jgi:hypothetical protein
MRPAGRPGRRTSTSPPSGAHGIRLSLWSTTFRVGALRCLWKARVASTGPARRVFLQERAAHTRGKNVERRVFYVLLVALVVVGLAALPGHAHAASPEWGELADLTDAQDIQVQGDASTDVVLVPLLDQGLMVCRVVLSYSYEYSKPPATHSEQSGSAAIGVAPGDPCATSIEKLGAAAAIKDSGVQPFSNVWTRSSSASGPPPGPVVAPVGQSVPVYTPPYDYHGVGSQVEWSFSWTVRYKSGWTVRWCLTVHYTVGSPGASETGPHRC